MMSYRVKLEKDTNNTLLVTSKDFPGVVTFGETREAALNYALGAFEEAIEARIARRMPIPPPAPAKSRGLRVTLPFQTEVKVLLYRQMLESNIRKSDLARKMHLHRQEVDRLLRLNHATSIGRIQDAFAALGKTLNITVSDAA
jgi:antitoxin HicB